MAGVSGSVSIAATGVNGAGATQIFGVISDGVGGGVLNLAKSGVSALRLANTANT